MCESTLHQVIELLGDTRVLGADLNGVHHQISLLALDGAVPSVGTWLVVHSGYAIERVEESDAQVALAELRRARAIDMTTNEQTVSRGSDSE